MGMDKLATKSLHQTLPSSVKLTESRWVDVVNPDGIDSPHGLREFGEQVVVPAEATVALVNELSEDVVLVRVTAAPARNRFMGYGTFAPLGTSFVMSRADYVAANKRAWSSDVAMAKEFFRKAGA